MTVRSRFLTTTIAAIAALSVGVGVADARVGGSKSSGSRGTQSTTPPPATSTAPKPAAPMERSTAPTAGAATAGAAQAAKPGMFSGMGKGLLMGGLMGFGLAGLFGGFGAMGAMFGMLLQLALLGGVIFLAYNFFRNRNRPAMASGPATGPMTGTNPLNRNAMAREMSPQQANLSGNMGGSGFGGPAPSAPVQPKLDISGDDFNAFETMLTKAQLSYGRQDRAALPFLATPEMVSYFNDDLDADEAQGVRNELSDVKLLQGDLAEAWVEKDGEFATVAMRYALRDAKVDIKSGRVVSGSKTELQEVTEIWTFRRPRGAPVQAWRVSAIQQTN
jgi:predicted lipid-binding transport protein (Tim44 family)